MHENYCFRFLNRSTNGQTSWWRKKNSKYYLEQQMHKYSSYWFLKLYIRWNALIRLFCIQNCEIFFVLNGNNIILSVWTLNILKNIIEISTLDAVQVDSKNGSHFLKRNLPICTFLPQKHGGASTETLFT